MWELFALSSRICRNDEMTIRVVLTVLEDCRNLVAALGFIYRQNEDYKKAKKLNCNHGFGIKFDYVVSPLFLAILCDKRKID